MAVVVNEMEITPATESTTTAASADGNTNGKALDPREVERAVVKQMERRARLRAH